MEKRGILIAADANAEWMMPWWHTHLRQHSALPITIIDLGMTQNGLMRARDFGEVISPKYPKMTVDEPLLDTWKRVYAGDLSKVRKTWLYKPFLFSQSPYEETVWLDLDCKVRGSIDPIFDFFETEGGLCAAAESPTAQLRWRDLNLIDPDADLYNGGVIGYRKDAPLLLDWQREVHTHHAQYYSDQEALSHVLHKTPLTWNTLPRAFNSRTWEEDDPKMIIIHYANAHKKLDILREIILTQIFHKPV